MILSDDQRSALKAELAKPGYAGLTVEAVVAALNAVPTVANPTPQGQVPRAFTLEQLLAACAPGSRAALTPILTVVTPFVLAQDRPNINKGLDAYVLAGAVAQADAEAMRGVLALTDPDPAWPATVPGRSPFRTLFGDSPFEVGAVTYTGHATPEMIAEALS